MWTVLLIEESCTLWMQPSLPCLTFEVCAPAIARGSHREVNPDDVALLFYQQFVVVLAVQVAEVE
jgi:hypothetical protein